MLHKRFSGPAIGWGAVTLTVIIWVAYAITMRAISFSTLTTMDVAVIRFGTPAILLAYMIPRVWREIRQYPLKALLLMAFGAGLPFFLFTAWGTDLSSATLAGVINPGLPPMFVALIGYLFQQRPLRKIAITGYIGISIGIIMLVASSPAEVGLLGAIFLILSALLWALYSIGMEQTMMNPLSAAVLVSAPSAVIATVLMGLNLESSQLLSAPIQETIAFALVLGVGVGVLSIVAYSSAINHLSARTSATAGAISPGLTALLAIPIFGEQVTVIGAIGIGLVAVGILLANRR